MPTIRDILAGKGRGVISVSPEHTVRQAIVTLIERRIGSLLVLDTDGTVAGILTERDILRIVHEHTDRLDSAPVSEFMTRDVMCAVPDDDIDYAMNVMTENRFRRMPVVEDNSIVGIVSIGDLVKAIKSHKEYENRMLREYISGTYA